MIFTRNTLIVGGVRSAICKISGIEVYKYLKFESGIHRVQRVPKTESKGRMHTSTASVAILPQPSQVSQYSQGQYSIRGGGVFIFFLDFFNSPPPCYYLFFLEFFHK